MSVPNVTAQKLCRMSLQKIGVINRQDNFVPNEMMADTLDGLWQLLDSFNGQDLLVPYITHVEFPVNSLQRVYTYGDGGDFDSPRPLEIVAASWRDSAGTEYPIELQTTRIYVSGQPYKETSQGRPNRLYWEESYPTSQIFLEYFPMDGDTLLLKVKLPFSAEYCPCCDEGSDCATGCVDPSCAGGNVDPDDYTVSVAGCPDGDSACVLSGQTQMDAYLATQCSTDCSQTYEQDFSYDPGGGAITITATAVPTPRIAMKPTQLALTQNTEFPPAYQNLIIWNLAEFMAPEFNMEPSMQVMRQAAAAMRNIKKRNSRPPMASVDRALRYPRHPYNVLSGPTGGL